jgi:hypothetical protein
MEILRGWDEIRQALDGVGGKGGAPCENTVRRLVRQEGLPVTYVSRSPVTTRRLLVEWVERRCLRDVLGRDGVATPQG